MTTPTTFKPQPAISTYRPQTASTTVNPAAVTIPIGKHFKFQQVYIKYDERQLRYIVLGVYINDDDFDF